MSWIKRSLEPSLRSPGAVAIAVLALSFVLAYAMDSKVQRLRDEAGATFNFLPVAFLSAVVPLFVVTGILALNWLVLRRLPPSRFIATAYLIAGFLVVVEYLSFLVGFPLWLRKTILGSFRYAMMDFGPQSSIYYLACACIVIGVAALQRRRKTPPKATGALSAA